MKKRTLFITLLALVLVSCKKGDIPSNTPYDSTPTSTVTSETSTGDSTTTEEPAIEVTVYFNLTKHGLFDGNHGAAIPEVSLEYGVAYIALSGSELPGATRVTHDLGAAFIGFFMQNPQGGGLQKITKMPGVQGLVLEAAFEETTSSEDPTTSETPDENKADVYLVATKGTYDPAYQTTKGFSTILNCDEYMLLSKSFEAGFTFYIGSQFDISGLGANEYPTYLSGKADGIGYTLSADKDEGNYTANYLELVGEPSESGINTEDHDATWIKFNSPAEVLPLRFKTSGTYNVYITFWDNFGWVRIYVQPA